MDNKKIGELGETFACCYLKKKGYKIIERNYRTRGGEIDIVAWDKKEKLLVFTEVKTRRQDDFGQPQEAVDFFKQRNLLRTARGYLDQKEQEADFRIDIIAIFLDYSQRRARIRHFKNAVEEHW